MTAEGRAVADILEHDGIWKVAGNVGAIYGMDLREALAAMPAGLDLDLARDLFLCAERPFVNAWIDKNKPPSRA